MFANTLLRSRQDKICWGLTCNNYSLRDFAFDLARKKMQKCIADTRDIKKVWTIPVSARRVWPNKILHIFFTYLHIFFVLFNTYCKHCLLFVLLSIRKQPNTCRMSTVKSIVSDSRLPCCIVSTRRGHNSQTSVVVIVD